MYDEGIRNVSSAKLQTNEAEDKVDGPFLAHTATANLKN
jgi:hypothetical protein